MNADLKIIDDYFGYPQLQRSTAEDIVAQLWEPDHDFSERLQDFEYVNRSQMQPLTDEFQLLAASFRLERWRAQVAKRFGDGAFLTNIVTTTVSVEPINETGHSWQKPVPA